MGHYASMVVLALASFAVFLLNNSNCEGTVVVVALKDFWARTTLLR